MQSYAFFARVGWAGRVEMAVINNPPIFCHRPMMSSACICAMPSLRRMMMAKGQIKSNKEVKKPKKSKEVVVPPNAIKPFNIAVKK
jgi:hypothetical protein